MSRPHSNTERPAEDPVAGATSPSALWPVGVVFLCAEAGGYLMPLLLGPMAATYAIGEAFAGVIMAIQLGSFAVAAIGLSPWLATAAIARTADPDRAFARVFIAVVLMTLAFFLLLPSVMAGQDARLLFLGIACLPLLALPALPALSNHTAVVQSALTQRAGPLSLQSALICGAIALYSVAANAYWVYLERIATNIGMTPAAYGQAFAAGSVLALVGPVAAERLGTRAGRLPPLVLSCVLLGSSGWLATHATTPALFVLGISISSAALLFGMPYLLGLAAMIDRTGRVAGASRGFNNIGSAMAPALAGGILGITGAYSSIGWTSVIAATAALGLVLLCSRHATQAAAEY